MNNFLLIHYFFLYFNYSTLALEPFSAAVKCVNVDIRNIALLSNSFVPNSYAQTFVQRENECLRSPTALGVLPMFLLNLLTP